MAFNLKNKFLANASSVPHFLGHFILIAAGEITDQMAGFLFLAATGVKLVAGHKDRGMQASAILSMIGVAVLFEPAFRGGDVSGIVACLINMAGLCYALFGHRLDVKFSNHPSPLVQWALGESRKRLRDSFLIAKLPAVVFAMLVGDWALLAAQIVYAGGDILLGFSKTEAQQG